MINATPVRPVSQPTSGTPTYTPPMPMSAPPVPPVANSTIGSSFTSKPKRSFSPKLLLGILLFFLVLLGAGAGLYLTQVNQDLRQQAYGTCPLGSTVISGGVDSGACSCPNGSVVDPGTVSCPDIICSNYTTKSNCDSTSDTLTCFWSTATNTCATAGSTPACPVGSTKITGGVDAGACKCTESGRVIETDGTCAVCGNGTCESQFNETVGVCPSDCGQGSGGRCTTKADCESGFVCTSTPYGKWCTPQTTSLCGNNTCDINETVGTCPADCLGKATDCSNDAQCGTGLRCQLPQGLCVSTTSTCNNNQVCDAGENKITCPSDCGAGGSRYCDRSAPSTNQCTDKMEGTSCQTSAGQAGYCSTLIPGGITTADVVGGANSECICFAPAASTPPGNGGGVTPPGNGGGGNGSNDVCTLAAGQRCGVSSGTCCANGGVCQGMSGQEVCQIPTTSPSQQCATGGGTCTGWYGFRCSVLTNGTCHENGLRFPDRSTAENHSGTCGQVDQVCVGGDNDGHLCGDFTIYNQCAGTPPNNPTIPPTNPPTTPPGPMCMQISMSINGTMQGENQGAPALGDTLQFTCGQVEGISNYVFRVIEPGGIEKQLAATGATSVPYTVDKVGEFIAQCQICTGSAPSTCQAFETTSVSAE